MAKKNSMRNDYDRPPAEPQVSKYVLQEERFAGGVDSGRWRSGFRNDVDQDYEVMPIMIPTRCRSQIATASEW
jgi:hypothetical protein